MFRPCENGVCRNSFHVPPRSLFHPPQETSGRGPAGSTAINIYLDRKSSLQERQMP